MRVSWRTCEWWGCGIALFLQTGGLFPLMMIAMHGGLDDHSKSLLRVVALPAYAITIVLLVRHRKQLMLAIRRNILLTLLLAMPFVSILWSISPSISLRRAVALALSVSLAYLLAIRFTPRQLFLLIAMVLVPCMILSLATAIAVPHLGHMSDGEVRGIFTHKNVLGWFATTAVLACIAVAVSESGRRRQIFVLMATICAFALIASSSMTGMLSIFTGLSLVPFFLLLARVKGKSRLVYVVIGLEVIVLVLWSLAEFTGPALEALGKDATLTGRLPLWEHVDAAIHRSPIVGYGYKAFWSAGNPALWEIWDATGWQPPHAHNGYREMLLDFGLLGFLPFLLLLSRSLFYGLVLHCQSPRAGWLWLNVFAGMFLVMNFTEALLMEQNSFFFILFATIILMFGSRGPEALAAFSETSTSPVRVTYLAPSAAREISASLAYGRHE